MELYKMLTLFNLNETCCEICGLEKNRKKYFPQNAQIKGAESADVVCHHLIFFLRFLRIILRDLRERKNRKKYFPLNAQIKGAEPADVYCNEKSCEIVSALSANHSAGSAGDKKIL